MSIHTGRIREISATDKFHDTYFIQIDRNTEAFRAGELANIHRGCIRESRTTEDVHKTDVLQILKNHIRRVGREAR